VIRVRDHPGCGGLPSAVLTCVAAKPFVERGLAAVELVSVVAAGVQRL
jgi:hypothetical protein